jgi:hypothetical protein
LGYYFVVIILLNEREAKYMPIVQGYRRAKRICLKLAGKHWKKQINRRSGEEFLTA